MVKKRIRNVIGMMIMTAAIVFSVIQLNTPVVRAAGCPDPATVGCGCTFLHSISGEYNGRAVLWCNYSCQVCGSGGGGEPMYIELTVMVYDD